MAVTRSPTRTPRIKSVEFDLLDTAGRLIKLDYSRVELFERNLELDAIRASLQEARSGRAQCVLFEGVSGSGKSCLVSSFLSDIRDGYICKAKFDERSSQAFGATVDAIDGLFDGGLPPETVEEVLKACDVGALKKFLPSLSKFAIRGGQTKTTVQPFIHSSSSDFDRMKVAIRDIIRVVSAQSTLILVLDDLHWADHGSQQIVETLMNDLSSARKFLLLVMYRPVASDHILAQNIGRTLSSSIKRIRVSNLSVHGVNALLASLLRNEADEVEPLATTVHHKTQGNPLFVGHFIRLLEQKHMIWFSLTSYKWMWDIDRIISDTDISDNMLDVLVSKIRNMPPLNQDALVRAACLGTSQISDATLKCILVNRDLLDDTSLRDVVDPLVNEGLLEILPSKEYKFSHDKIRESAYMLLSDDRERKSLHLSIGRRLDELRAVSGEDGELLTLAVRQLNSASDLITDTNERVDLAERNYQAAEQAMELLSFYPASEFLRNALSLLGQDPWTTNHELATKIYAALTRSEYFCGRLDESLRLADDVLNHVNSFAEKHAVYRVKIRTLIQRGKGDEAWKVTLSALEELGISFPAPQFLKQEASLLQNKIYMMLHGMSDEELLNLPNRGPDDVINWRASFLEFMIEVIVHTHHGQTGYLDLALLSEMELTLLEGRLSYTPAAFAMWAWYLTSKCRYDDALRFGKIALQLSSQGASGVYDSRAVLVYFYFVFHWSMPYQNGVAPFAAGIKSAWDSGAVELVHLNTTCYFRLYFVAGLQLDGLVNDIRKFADLMKDYSTSSIFRGNQSFFQMIWNLTGLDDEMTRLTGEFLDQEESEKEWMSCANEKNLQKLYFSQLVVATYFGDFELAFAVSRRIVPNDEMDGPSPFIPMRVFFIGLAHAVLANTTKQRRHRTQRDSIIRTMESWVSQGNVNCHHMLLLLTAEKMVGKNVDVVQKAFDAAISAAGRSGFLNNRALANERAGIYFLSQNDSTWASTYLRRASETYREWGAAAKTKQLFEKYGATLSHADFDSSYWISGGSEELSLSG